MAKRFTETTKWGDPWFSELEASKKLLWLYLLDTCDHAGVYKHSPRLTQFHTDERHTVESICELFPNRCLMISEELIFIPKFLKFQYPSGIGSNKPAIVSVVKRLNELNLMNTVEELFSNDYIMIKESLKNSSKTIKDKDKVKDKSKVKETEKEKEQREMLKEQKDLFESQYWPMIKKCFPSRQNKQEAKAKWNFFVDKGFEGKQIWEYFYTKHVDHDNPLEGWTRGFHRKAVNELDLMDWLKDSAPVEFPEAFTKEHINFYNQLSGKDWDHDQKISYTYKAIEAAS